MNALEPFEIAFLVALSTFLKNFAREMKKISPNDLDLKAF